MELRKALRLPPVPRLALVGAGGKTTALFRLAREFIETSGGIAASTVLVTTTTHLGVKQARLADHHFEISSQEELVVLERDLPPGVVLVSGPATQADPERLTSLEDAGMERLHALAEARNLPILIEADGSRLRPLKAPAEYEPALPGFAGFVVVTAGLAGLDRPLSEEWVHRPEQFALLSGLELQETVTVEALARVLLHPKGGLKQIPPEAHRAALLTGVDSPERLAQASRLADLLLPAYLAVIAANLSPDGLKRETESEAMGPALAVFEPAAGVILAAGGSARYGAPKQLLDWQGEPLVRRVARTALEAGLSPVVAVTGARAEAVQGALAGLAVKMAFNPVWKQGQSTSLQTGLDALPSWVGAAVFLLADQPQVSSELLRALVDRHARSLAPVTAPRVGGRRANPVLFDREAFPALRGISGDSGGRQLFARPEQFPVAWVDWDDPDLLLDVDTPEDYARLVGRQGNRG